MRFGLSLYVLALAAPLAVQTAVAQSDAADRAYAMANHSELSNSYNVRWARASERTPGPAGAFAKRYGFKAAPAGLLFSHESGGSFLYIGFNGTGDLVGAITPFGVDPCSPGPQTRAPSLFLIVDGVRKPVAMKPLERMTYSGADGKPQTLCFQAVKLTAAELKTRFGTAKDKAPVHWAVVVDKDVNHTIWTGERAPNGKILGKVQALYTVKQMRDIAALAVKEPV